jgi:hypothetical protein
MVTSFDVYGKVSIPNPEPIVPPKATKQSVFSGILLLVWLGIYRRQ